MKNIIRLNSESLTCACKPAPETYGISDRASGGIFRVADTQIHHILQ